MLVRAHPEQPACPSLVYTTDWYGELRVGVVAGEGEDVGRSLERSGAEKQDTDAGGSQCSPRFCFWYTVQYITVLYGY